jgi:hypothetical protein
LCCQQKKRLKIWLAGGFDSLTTRHNIFMMMVMELPYEKAIRYGEISRK